MIGLPAGTRIWIAEPAVSTYHGRAGNCREADKVLRVFNHPTVPPPKQAGTRDSRHRDACHAALKATGNEWSWRQGIRRHRRNWQRNLIATHRSWGDGRVQRAERIES